MYVLTSTAELNVPADLLWDVLTDVEQWPTWDPHEEASRLDGAFVSGTHLWTKPTGAPASTAVLEDVRPGVSWAAHCPLPGGILRSTTTLCPIDAGRTTITRSMEVSGPFTLLFRMWSATRSLSRVQAVCQGQSRGRCRTVRRARVAIRHGVWISLRRTDPVVARASCEPFGAARVAAARVRLNAITARTSQAALAVNTPDGRCASDEFFKSAWTCSMIAC